jgi:hypothetical protein
VCSPPFTAGAAAMGPQRETALCSANFTNRNNCRQKIKNKNKYLRKKKINAKNKPERLHGGAQGA